MNYIFVDFEVEKNSQATIRGTDVQSIERIRVNAVVLDELYELSEEEFDKVPEYSVAIRNQSGVFAKMTDDMLSDGRLLNNKLMDYVNWCLALSREVTAIGLVGKKRELAVKNAKLGRINYVYESEVHVDDNIRRFKRTKDDDDQVSMELIKSQFPESIHDRIEKAIIQPLYMKDYELSKSAQQGKACITLTNKVKAVRIYMAS